MTRRGLLDAVAAYALWGLFPAYFLLMQPVGPFEIVVWRILFSLAFCLIVIAVLRRWRPLLTVLRSRRSVLLLGVGAVLVYANWQMYVWAVTTGHVVEAALGYFINPIVTVFLGVVFLRERLRIAQWIAVAISAAAVVVLIIGYGQAPWIALTLAASFGGYSLVKNRVGRTVDALSGLAIETAVATPIALIQLVIIGATTGIVFGSAGGWNTLIVSTAGIVTAVPLLLFASAAGRLPLSLLGLVQYLTPLLQFLYGVLIAHEPMPVERWIGFALVWVALGVLIADSLLASRRHAPTIAA